MNNLEDIIVNLEQIRGLPDIGNDAVEELDVEIDRLCRLELDLKHVIEIVINKLGWGINGEM